MHAGRPLMVDMENLSESIEYDREIGAVTGRLASELDLPHREAEIRPAVESAFKRFDDARVREFVPVFVERQIRADLRALARV